MLKIKKKDNAKDDKDSKVTIKNIFPVPVACCHKCLDSSGTLVVLLLPLGLLFSKGSWVDIATFWN